MNLTANFLGLGNAATPAGLKAMEGLKEKNGKNGGLSDEMKMLILVNTASIQLIPTSIIAIRQSLNSNNPTDILVPVWCATFCAAFTGIFVLKLMIKKGK